MDGRVRVNDNMEISYRRTHTEENKHIRTSTQIQLPSIASHVHFAAAFADSPACPAGSAAVSKHASAPGYTSVPLSYTFFSVVPSLMT